MSRKTISDNLGPAPAAPTVESTPLAGEPTGGWLAERERSPTAADANAADDIDRRQHDPHLGTGLESKRGAY